MTGKEISNARLIGLAEQVRHASGWSEQDRIDAANSLRELKSLRIEIAEITRQRDETYDELVHVREKLQRVIYG